MLALRRDLKLTRRRVSSQQRHILELKARYDDYDQKLQNTSRKLNAVLQELSRCKTELQYWRSKSPAVSSCSCGKTTPTLVHEPSSLPNFADSFTLDQMLDDPTDTVDFTPIDIQEASSSTSVLAGEGQLKVVPACYSTPPENVSALGLNKSERLVLEEEGESHLSEDKALPRGCKRKLDLEIAPCLVLKVHKIQRVPPSSAE